LPEAAATGPSVDFSDASTDLDGAITAWSWDFGDGNGSAAQGPIHVYAGGGTYTVTLTVTDNASGEMALVIESTASEETVVDQDGRRIGLVDGRPVLEMSSVSFLSAVVGDDGRVGAFWLPAGGEYTAEIRGYAEEKIDLQILVPTGLFSGLVIIFEEVQMMPGSVARLVLAEDSGQLSLSVDLNGDGQVDQTILPSQSVEVGLMP
jgi:PKD repeat protein